jgi:hypothetical protein
VVDPVYFLLISAGLGHVVFEDGNRNIMDPLALDDETWLGKAFEVRGELDRLLGHSGPLFSE